MSQLILGVHSGSHDAAAALFDGYALKAAVSLERLTRNKGDGAYPDLAIDEVLSIAGATRKDVDVVCHSRTLMPTRYFRDLSLFDRIKELHLHNVEMRYLSMGMTNSYQVAIEEGANLVRIGTKIFGERGGRAH